VPAPEDRLLDAHVCDGCIHCWLLLGRQQH
jgi:hypothetical protein